MATWGAVVGAMAPLWCYDLMLSIGSFFVK